MRSTMRSTSTDSRPHVVIIGGGFGGLAAARTLANADVRITLLDRENHHTFQPLLYQVATAALAPSDITVPIRWRLRSQRNVQVLLASVTRVEPTTREVVLDDGTVIGYDYLVVATGARHAYFGHGEWEEFAPGLKSVDDALEMRQRFLLAFERAERATDPAERAAQLTFVVVGGGPTGAELAGSMADIVHGPIARDFRSIDTKSARVMLVEAGPRLLPMFTEDLSLAAKRDLESIGVEVRLGKPVTNITESSVTIGTDVVPAYTVFWAAGTVASPLGGMLGAETDNVGRVKVAPDCSVPAHPEIFVVGDLITMKRPNGQPVPAVAPTANQTGAHAGEMILASIRGEPRRPYVYFHKGDLATIGRHKAVAAFGPVHFSGYKAWFLWLFVHLLYLVGFRNRISVMVQWGYAYFTFQRGVRLISGSWRDDAFETHSVPIARVPHHATIPHATPSHGVRAHDTTSPAGPESKHEEYAPG